MPATGGSQPDRLMEVRPQERVQRRTVEQIILAPMLVREPQLAEQLLEVPTIISFSSLQRIVEQNVDIPVPYGGVRRLQGFHPGQGSATSPSSLERMPERSASRSLTSPCLVEAFKIFAQDMVQRLRSFLHTFQLVPWTSRFMWFFALFPGRKKGARLGPHSGSELSADFISSTPSACGTPLLGVRKLLS